MADTAQKLAALKHELNQLRARCDASFAQVAQAHPQAVACGAGCDDCCHALFDLAPVEALAIRAAFAGLGRRERREALRRAERAVRDYDQALGRALARQGEERLAELSAARVACPLLAEGRCLLYAERPATCRLYGIPVAVGGQPRTCSRAGFRPGQSYPTVHLEKVQEELDRLSQAALALVPGLPPRRLDVARALSLEV
jgi:Fe-S-cluster containining protein